MWLWRRPFCNGAMTWAVRHTCRISRAARRCRTSAPMINGSSRTSGTSMCAFDGLSPNSEQRGKSSKQLISRGRRGLADTTGKCPASAATLLLSKRLRPAAITCGVSEQNGCVLPSAVARQTSACCNACGNYCSFQPLTMSTRPGHARNVASTDRKKRSRPATGGCKSQATLASERPCCYQRDIGLHVVPMQMQVACSPLSPYPRHRGPGVWTHAKAPPSHTSDRQEGDSAASLLSGALDMVW